MNTNDYESRTKEKQQMVNKSLRLLRDGFKREFVDKIYEDERFTELVMEISAEFVEENIPVIHEDDRYDLAMMLMDTIKLEAF